VKSLSRQIDEKRLSLTSTEITIVARCVLGQIDPGSFHHSCSPRKQAFARVTRMACYYGCVNLSALLPGEFRHAPQLCFR
jgi:hypothetical protein